MERACFLENSNESTKKFTRVERESAALETGPSLVVVVGASVVVSVAVAEAE